MLGAPSETPCVSTLDAFYEELAERAEDESLCLPWYKTCLVMKAPRQNKRFRSEITLPGLRLQSMDGEKYFIPEAKFIGNAENRKEAENAAAYEACGFLMTFTQRSQLIASEWMIDSNNPLYNRILEAQPAPSTSSNSSEPDTPREGHHLLVIAPVVRLNYKNRKDLRPKPPSHNGPPPSPNSSKQPTGSSSTTNGENLALLSHELNLLRIQMDRLNSLVEQHHPQQASASMTQPASSSHRPNIEPT